MAAQFTILLEQNYLVLESCEIKVRNREMAFICMDRNGVILMVYGHFVFNLKLAMLMNPIVFLSKPSVVGLKIIVLREKKYSQATISRISRYSDPKK